MLCYFCQITDYLLQLNVATRSINRNRQTYKTEDGWVGDPLRLLSVIVYISLSPTHFHLAYPP